MKSKPSRRASIPIALGAFALVAACGRSGLEADDWQWIDGVPQTDDAGKPVKDGSAPGFDAAQSQCIPKTEVCNGADDDCNGAVDDVPSIACPGGGAQYCIAGHMSECPKACDICLPGSERVCFNSFCKYWAIQTCTADGKSFGSCKEMDPPAECAGVAKAHQYSSQLEQCCLDNDYCCSDDFDLDHDGNTSEMIGNCEEVQCSP